MQLIRTVLLFSLVMAFFVAEGQISIKFSTTESREPLDDELLEEIKSRPTLFVARNEDDTDLLEEELKKVWSLTEIQVVKYEDLEDYTSEGDYSFFDIQGHFLYEIVNGIKNGYECGYVYLIFHLNTLDEEGEVVSKRIARMELHPDIGTLVGLSDYVGKENTDEFFNHIYNDAELYNWNPLMIVNFAKQVNDHIEERRGRVFITELYDDKRLGALANQKLYVPDYILRKYSPIKYSEDKFHEPEKLFSKYPYEYEVVSMERLLEKYQDGEEPFFYLSTVKSCNRLLISVVDGLTGEIIYSDPRNPGIYNIKTVDMKYLSGKIKSQID